MKENITSGQSGDCLVYSGLLTVYTWRSAHKPWSVRLM